MLFLKSNEPEKFESILDDKSDALPSEMCEKSAEMVGYSTNFGLNFSLSESQISNPDTNKRLPTHLDDIRLETYPNWLLSVNRQSSAARRSTVKSLKRVTAERHEEMIR